MPYSSIAAAKTAGAKTTLGAGKLRLPQINALAAVADRLKKDPKIKEPYAVAITQFKKGHHTEDGWWVKNKGGTRELEAEEQELCDELMDGIGGGEWTEHGTKIIHRHAHPEPENVFVLESPPAGTRTIPDVELLKEGVHIDRFGHTLVVSPDKIKQIPAIYRRLVSLGFRPPVRLTHDPHHPLANGYPSLGWPDVPRAWLDPADNKWTLNSDLLGVPMKFADIMEAGGFDRISCGLYEDVKVGDFMAPLAIDHVAVLGVTHPAVTELKGISDIHKLYENEMADRDQVEVSAAYLFEDGGLTTQIREGEGAMPMSKEQLVEYGCTTEDELKAKLAKAAEADKDKETAATAVKELEAAHEKIRLGAAEGFIGTNRKKFPPALDDYFRAVHMGLTERAEATVEFSRPTNDGKIETVKLDPVASLTAIVAKFGTAIELQDEKAPEGGTDQEHETEDEKKIRLKAEAKKKEDKKGEGGEDQKEGETDERVELARGDGIAVRTKMAVEQRTLASFIKDRDECPMGDAMSQAAIELERAGYGTDHYVPPEGLEKKDKKDEKK